MYIFDMNSGTGEITSKQIKAETVFSRLSPSFFVLQKNNELQNYRLEQSSDRKHVYLVPINPDIASFSERKAAFNRLIASYNEGYSPKKTAAPIHRATQARTTTVTPMLTIRTRKFHLDERTGVVTCNSLKANSIYKNLSPTLNYLQKISKKLTNYSLEMTYGGKNGEDKVRFVQTTGRMNPSGLKLAFDSLVATYQGSFDPNKTTQPVVLDIPDEHIANKPSELPHESSGMEQDLQSFGFMEMVDFSNASELNEEDFIQWLNRHDTENSLEKEREEIKRRENATKEELKSINQEFEFNVGENPESLDVGRDMNPNPDPYVYDENLLQWLREQELENSSRMGEGGEEEIQQSAQEERTADEQTDLKRKRSNEESEEDFMHVADLDIQQNTSTFNLEKPEDVHVEEDPTEILDSYLEQSSPQQLSREEASFWSNFFRDTANSTSLEGSSEKAPKTAVEESNTDQKTKKFKTK